MSAVERSSQPFKAGMSASQRWRFNSTEPTYNGHTTNSQFFRRSILNMIQLMEAIHMNALLPCKVSYLQSAVGCLITLAVFQIVSICGASPPADVTQLGIRVTSSESDLPSSQGDSKGPLEIGNRPLASNGSMILTDQESTACASGQCRRGCFKNRTGTQSSGRESNFLFRLTHRRKCRH